MLIREVLPKQFSSAHAGVFGVERQIVGVQGTMFNRIASSEPQWVVAKSEVNNEVIFSFRDFVKSIGYISQ